LWFCVVIPAGQKIDSLVGRRPGGILLIWRIAATPTLRAYKSALTPTGITVGGLTPKGRMFRRRVSWAGGFGERLGELTHRCYDGNIKTLRIHRVQRHAVDGQRAVGHEF
jgi:hypothetical protein